MDAQQYKVYRQKFRQSHIYDLASKSTLGEGEDEEGEAYVYPATLIPTTTSFSTPSSTNQHSLTSSNTTSFHPLGVEEVDMAIDITPSEGSDRASECVTSRIYTYLATGLSFTPTGTLTQWAASLAPTLSLAALLPVLVEDDAGYATYLPPLQGVKRGLSVSNTNSADTNTHTNNNTYTQEQQQGQQQGSNEKNKRLKPITKFDYFLNTCGPIADLTLTTPPSTGHNSDQSDGIYLTVGLSRFGWPEPKPEKSSTGHNSDPSASSKASGYSTLTGEYGFAQDNIR